MRLAAKGRWMRIGLIVPGFSANADDWCIPALRDLVEALARHDEVWVLALRYPPTRHEYAVFGATVTALAGGTRARLGSATLWSSAFAAIRSEHRRRPFDVLHAFWADEAGAIAAIAGRFFGIRSIVSLAGGELVGFRDIGYGSQLRLSGRLKVVTALRLATAVTAGSEYECKLAAPWLRAKPAGIRRVPLGVALDRFNAGDAYPGSVSTSDAAGQTDGVPRVVHVASLVPVKDQRTLLRAAAFARDAGARFTLEIYGAGPLESSLRSLAIDLGLWDIARFHGAVPHHDLPRIYRAATLFALSSRHEAQCMAVLEAAACGVPTVGTSVGVVTELAQAGTAWAVPVADDRSLGRAIASILADRSTLARRACTSRSIAGESFGLNRCSSEFRMLYG